MNSLQQSRFASHSRFGRFLARPAVMIVGIAVYVFALFLILLPALAASVGADDSYWILEVAPASDGSYLSAFWEPLSHAFDFDGQARSTALATAERRVAGLFTIQFATTFSVPPALPWGLIKVGFLALAPLAIAFLLRQFRFRDRSGFARPFTSPTILFIALSLPAFLAIGMKAQRVSSYNGWLYYPSLTYEPIVLFPLLAGAAIWAVRRLDARFGLASIPIALVAAVTAVALNLAYEFMALAVPLVVLAVLMQPLPQADSLWRRWRGRLFTLGIFGGVFTALFAWIRWRISQMECHLDDSCYQGTILSLDPQTILFNFFGAVPGGVGPVIQAQYESTGRHVAGATVTSLALALLVVLALAVIVAAWRIRVREVLSDVARAELPGLVRIAVFALVVAVGAALITGTNERAVETLESRAIPYRNGVITWWGIALVLALFAYALFALGNRVVTTLGLVAVAAVVATTIALSYPQNVVSAQIARVQSNTRFFDTVHLEVANGDVSKAGDRRRCQAIEDFTDGRESVSMTIVRVLVRAYESFQYYHNQPYCSTGAGLQYAEGVVLDESHDRG